MEGLYNTNINRYNPPIATTLYHELKKKTIFEVNFHEQQVPDATTLLKFRHMLEKNKINEKIFADVNERLGKSGLIMHGETIVDARLIVAPKSTKNKNNEHLSQVEFRINKRSSSLKTADDSEGVNWDKNGR